MRSYLFLFNLFTLCAYGGAHATVYVCRSVDNFQELILSFHCIEGTQASRLGDKCLSLLSHCARPGRIFIEGFLS